MANLLESSQTQESTAPAYYNTYLSDLATKGATAASGAQYVGAQPLQEQAFKNVSGAASAYQPTLTAAGNTLTSATTNTSPLSAATDYLTQATSDPSKSAAGYMNPYITSVVNALGDTGQRNIIQNLAPQATAGAVGSGQFGSKRGAEVLGQTISNADRDILNAQSQALSTGYGQALNAATTQNQIAGQAGSTAANAAGTGTANLINAGNAQSNLAGQNQQLGLADINALATLGGQQQTIAQNKELFPLTNLSTLSGILRGYNVPTTTKTTAQASPLSAAFGAATGAAGLLTPKYDSLGKEVAGSSPLDQLKKAFGLDTTPAPTAKPDTGIATGNDAGSTGVAGVFTNSNSPTGLVNESGDPVNKDGSTFVGPTLPATGLNQNPYANALIDPNTGRPAYDIPENTNGEVYGALASAYGG
jgi:hypothetical protein